MYKITEEEIQKEIEINNNLYSLEKYGIKREVYPFNNTDISVFFPEQISLDNLIAEYHCKKAKKKFVYSNLLNKSQHNYEYIFNFNDIDNYVFNRYKSFCIGNFDLQHLLGVVSKSQAYFNLKNQNMDTSKEFQTFKKIQKKLHKTKKGTIKYLYNTYLKKIETYNAIIFIIKKYIQENINHNFYFDMYENNDIIIREVLDLKENTSLRNTSELTLFMMVKQIYPNAIYQFRDKFLGNQSLDVFIPDLKIAIEYQGQQHYEPINFFGGQEGFAKQQERDKRKYNLCISNNIKIIYWSYNEPFSKELLEYKIKNV